MAFVTIPTELLPTDGRFGSGPARVRPEQSAALAAVGTTVLGTSHRQAPVKDLVARIQAGLADLFDAPEGYRVLLSNGGSTFFWDSATFHLIRQRSAHGQAGEFGSKFTGAARRAPWLSEPHVVEAEPGSAAVPTPVDGVDLYAWAQNETSTGVKAPVRRVEAPGALTVIDATSAAGGIEIDITQTDVYYFAGQKNFSADGGIWFALASPAAVERIEELASERWAPQSLDLAQVLVNSKAHQTLNTPAISTLVLFEEQLQWILGQGGLGWATTRTRTSSDLLYRWAESAEYASPFVADPELRSPVVVTLEFDANVPAAQLTSILRGNGIVDVEPYRKLGRNQLRVATFPSVDPADVEALISSIEYVVERL